MTRQRWFSLIVILACLGFGGWGATHIEIHSELGRLAPGDEELAELSSVLAGSLLARTWAVLLESEEEIDRRCVARRVRASLLESGLVKREPSTEEVDQAFFELYFPRRNYFLADDAETRRTILSEQGLRRRLQALRRRLASPTGAFARKLAPEDPLLIFLGHLESMREASAARLRRDEDLLVTEDGSAAVLLLQTRFSAFDAEQAKRFERLVTTAHERAVGACEAKNVALAQSATHRFSWRTEQMIRNDIQRVSVFSTLGMIALFLLVLPAGRAFVGVFAPTLIGLSLAIGATALLFTRVHGMSVAFGSAMLGVCVDYAVHWVIHDFASDDPAADHEASRRVVTKSILLGAGTTIAGLALLAGASFPGMRELSFFACVGVSGAAAATLWLLPPWIKGQKVARTAALAARLEPVVMAMRRPQVGGAVVLLAAGLALGLVNARWSSGLEALLDRDPALVAEDEHVRNSIARFSAGRLVAVRAESTEQALQKLEQIEPILNELRDQGVIDVTQSVLPYLWSKELQQRNAAAINAPDVAARFARNASELGFAEGAFLWPQPPVVPPLGLPELKQSALFTMVSPFLAQVDGRTWAFAFLGQAAQIDAVRTALAEHEALVFDQAEFLADAFDAYRQRVFALGVAGLVVIFVVLLARYRRIRLAVAAFLPAALASLATLGLLGWIGAEINVLHLVALLLVLGIGVDYGVFVVEPFANASAPARQQTIVFLSIVTACITTTLSFGLLALSGYAPLRSMGAALMVGVPLSLLLAPLSSWLAARTT